MFLAGLLLPIDDQEQEKWLEDLTSHIQNQGLTIPNIEKSNIELAIKECGQSGSDGSETVFNVINAFDVPQYKYHQDRKKFLLNNTPKSILPEANCKVDYLRDRYTMLWQRTSRHDLFSPAVLGTSNSSVKKFQLKKIEALLATSKIDEVVVLGLLTQLEEGKFYLEDPSGVVKLDLKNVQFHSGLFCEGCYVLADGKYKDGILRVSGLGFPPPELANSSRAYFGTQNTWGGPSKTLLKYSQPLAIHERDNRDALMVFLSDCWLDHPLVLDKLNQLFIGYDDCPPVAIILMGPFAKNSDSPYFLKKKFQLIGETLGTCENLKRNTDIILVPSIEDPAAPNILPRPPLPEFLVSDLKKKYPRIILATNPVRLQYCTQQIVVCRADLVTKLCRNALQFPSNGPLADHVSHFFLFCFYWVLIYISFFFSLLGR